MAGSNYVAYNLAQARSDSEKLQARNNIGAAALASLAASFESRAPSYNWSAGEVCTYGGDLWQFDSNHSGAWTGADAHEVTISEVIDDKIDDVTLDPSAVALGNVHLLDEVTSFAADAKILVDSETNGPGAMSAEDLLKLTSQNALAGNVAPAFDPTRTSENPYKAGESVVYEGKTYTFKVDHYGAWAATDVVHIDAIDAVVNKIVAKRGLNFVFGTFSRSDVLFTSSDIPAGTKIVFRGKASGTVGYLRFHKTGGTAVNKGKTSASAPEDFAIEYTLPSDFDYCDVYAASDNTVSVSFLLPFNGDVSYDNANKKFIKSFKGFSSDICTAEQLKTDMGLGGVSTDITALGKVQKQLGNLSAGSFTNGTQLFDSSDVIPGSRIKYKFHVNSAAVGYLRFHMTDGTAVNKGKTSASDPVVDYEAEYTLPVNFDYCDVYSNSDNAVSIEYIVCGRIAEIEGSYPSLPHYYPSYMQSKCDTINAYMDAAVANGDAFVFITDQHWEDNAQKSPQMLKYLFEHTTVNKLFSGGDIYDGNHDYDYPTARAYMLQLRLTFNGTIYACVGNHDLFKQMPSSRLAAIYDMFHDDYHGNPEKHYYYVDNKRAKIRYIVLADYYESDTDNNVNGFPVDSVQQQWFLNDALNVESGWGIIIFTHQCWTNTSDTVTDLVLDSRFRDTLLSYVNAYNGNGEIICIVQGHTHCDRVMNSKTDFSGVPVIITTCDKNRAIMINGLPDIYPSDRASGTTREQAFDVFIVDRTNRQINIVRCGCEAYDGVGANIGNAVEVRTVNY